MNFQGGMNDISEISKIKEKGSPKASKEVCDKFDKLMGDDIIKDSPGFEDCNKPKLSSEERTAVFNKLFDFGDFFKKDMGEKSIDGENKGAVFEIKEDDLYDQNGNISSIEPNYFEQREPEITYDFNNNLYETDENGYTYKKNGITLPNIEYTVNGNKYKTDGHGNKVSCDANPEYTEEGARNMKEQKESGGDERQEDDDGGHIVARVLGGAEGEENLVPMRRTINRGDYKRMENEISKALQEGKKVHLHIDIDYERNSIRPSKLQSEYVIDGKKTICEFDNVEGSTDLLKSLKDKINDGDYNRLKQMLKEMQEDGCETAITSVKVEYEKDGNPEKVTVGILEEETGTKRYKEYIPG